MITIIALFRFFFRWRWAQRVHDTVWRRLRLFVYSQLFLKSANGSCLSAIVPLFSFSSGITYRVRQRTYWTPFYCAIVFVNFNNWLVSFLYTQSLFGVSAVCFLEIYKLKRILRLPYYWFWRQVADDSIISYRVLYGCLTVRLFINNDLRPVCRRKVMFGIYHIWCYSVFIAIADLVGQYYLAVSDIDYYCYHTIYCTLLCL